MQPPDPRWTKETVALVCDCAWVTEEDANLILTALADAGLLLPRTRTRVFRQFAVQVPGEQSVRGITLVRYLAEHAAERLAHLSPTVVTRQHTEHDEPWREVGDAPP